MKSMSQLLHEHPFFRGMDSEHLDFIGGCGENHIYNAGEYIARENAPADHFFLIRDGQVAVECYVPNYGALCLQTLQSGDIFGWSWLFAPYLWTFDARAVDEVHAIRLDGKCLREKCETDSKMGYELMKRFSHILTERLRATRVQLMDVYGERRPPLDEAT